jgi:vancomycin permeability regulator SanA
MTYPSAGNARTVFVILTATILTVGLCGDAVAKHGKRYLHARSFVSKRVVKNVQLVSQQPVRLGPMRYYGGPKSQMWRGPVAN